MRRFIYTLLILSLFAGCADKNKTVDNLESNISDSNITVVNIAKKYLGKPYEYGKTGPDSFDCSGFVYTVYREVGINIPRTSMAQSKIDGDKLKVGEIEEGDILFFDTSLKGHINHSGIYLGKHKFIHASSGKAHSVTISSLDGWYKDKFRWGKRAKIRERNLVDTNSTKTKK